MSMTMFASSSRMPMATCTSLEPFTRHFDASDYVAVVVWETFAVLIHVVILLGITHSSSFLNNLFSSISSLTNVDGLVDFNSIGRHPYLDWLNT